MGPGENLIILVVDDDPEDVLLLKQALLRNGHSLPVHHCQNGAEAISYLAGAAPFGDRALYPFPRVLITDLKMPKCNGFELLEWLRGHPQCGAIPAIVLSGSAEESDVRRAFELGAKSYFQKPSSFESFVSLMKLATDYWARALVPSVSRDG